MGNEDWQNRVDERLVDLTTAQKVTNDHLDQIDETLDALDRTIRGDYEKDHDGLVARFKEVEHSVSLLNAIILQDSTGKKGLVATVDALVSGNMEVVERRKHNVSIIIAIITSGALIITNLDKIGVFWMHLFGKPKPVEMKRIPRRVRTRPMMEGLDEHPGQD